MGPNDLFTSSLRVRVVNLGVAVVFAKLSAACAVVTLPVALNLKNLGATVLRRRPPSTAMSTDRRD